MSIHPRTNDGREQAVAPHIEPQIAIWRVSQQENAVNAALVLKFEF